jgi:hypothetical protein
MSLVAYARGFPNYAFPLQNVENYVAEHANYRNEPCIASTFERVDELTPIVNGTNDVRNAFLSTCEFKTERDNQEHIYYTSEDGDRLDVTALFRVGNFYLADEQ